MISRINRLAGGALLFLAAGVCPTFAGDFAQLQGAWVESGAPCKDVFVRKGNGFAFRQPVNPFRPALLISGSTIQGPASTCRIVSRRTMGERHVLALNCATSVAGGETGLVLGGEGDRLNQYPMANDKIGQGYDRCKP